VRRALFQIISKVMKNLQYLEPAVGLVLGFVGLKMVLAKYRSNTGQILVQTAL
jgi:predicted tellurium resistance membrane protein TerC